MTPISKARLLTTARPTNHPIQARLTVAGSPAIVTPIHINTPIVGSPTSTRDLRLVAILTIFNGLRQILGIMTAHLRLHLPAFTSVVILSDH